MASPAQEFAALQKLTPGDAVAYLQRRGQVSATYSWQDLWQAEHAHQFTISRLTQADLLQALNDGITESVKGNLSRRDWMRESEELLKRAGWWGEKTIKDPVTGKEVTTKFDRARLKLIFDTNTRNAYAAGQWERFQRTRRSHPYLRYVTRGDDRVRPAHRAWHNVTLPIDDSFWNTHSPPNGWRCRCTLVAVSQRDYDRGYVMDRPGAENDVNAPMVRVPLKKEAPPITLRDWTNPRTGEVMKVPVGIDPGWGYNVGAAGARAAQLQRTVADKLVKLSAPIGSALWDEIKGEMRPAQLDAWRAMVNAAASGRRAGGAAALAHVVPPPTIEDLAEKGVTLDSAAVLMRDTELMHAVRDTKGRRKATLSMDDWRDLPQLLELGAPYLDTEDEALIYLLDLGERDGKVVIRVNYSAKTRAAGERGRVTANFVQTGGVVKIDDIETARFVPLRK